MTKQTLTAAMLCIGATIAMTAPVRADIVFQGTLSSYDSPDGYDFVGSFPPSGSTTIGTFTFSIPADVTISGGTISGTFGNGDVPVTALSDYYLGYAGNEEAVPVASCDDIDDDCYSSQNGPTGWTYTLTGSDLAALAPGIDGGSLDFTYTWDNNTQFAFEDYLQYVYAGPATLDLVTPEPATILICFGGLAGVAALRRFRKV